MAANLFYMPYRPAYDSAGITVPGAKAYFTIHGTSTASAPYSNEALTTPRTNPVVANGAGKFPLTYLDPAVTYRVRIYSKNATVGVDTPLEDFNPYVPGMLDDVSFDATATAAANSATAASDSAAEAAAAAASVSADTDAAQEAAETAAAAQAAISAALAAGGSVSLDDLKGSGLPINVKWFGAEGDANATGTTGTDDTAAIQAAIDYADTTGGAGLLTPDGNFKSATGLDADSTHNLVIEGVSGGGAGYSQPPPSQLIYTGTGSGRFISAQATNAITIRDIGIRYSSGSYSGDLIAFNHSTVDAAYGLVEGVLAGGVNVNSARSLVSLEGAILCHVDRSHLQWGQVAIRCAKDLGSGNSLYSNAHSITRNTFDNVTTAITDAGQQLAVLCNAFEGTDGGSGGMQYAYKGTLPALNASNSSALAWCFNWHGDTSAAFTDTWFTNGDSILYGHLNACNYYNTGSALPAMKFTKNVYGAAILANAFSSTIDFANVAHTGVFVAGNFWTADPLNLHSSSEDIFIVANSKNGGYAPNIIRLYSVGEFRIGYPGIASGTGDWKFYAPTATEAKLTISGDGNVNRTIAFTTTNTARLVYGLDNSNQGAEIAYDALGVFVGYTRTINLATLAQTFGGTISAPSYAATGTILSSGGGVGYTTGAGGTVTQATSKSTGVTLNKLTGAITMHNASLAANTAVSFTLTNSQIGANDTASVNIKSGGTAGAYVVTVDAVAAGSCQISVRNLTAGALGEALVLNFNVHKGSAS